MIHDVTLIATLASGFGLALLFGYLAARVSLPPLVGYLIAGILIGPHTPGYIADAVIAAQLAEIGVMLLMFGVGLHFSLSDLMAVRRIAVPGAVVQIVVAVAMGWGVAAAWGWDTGAAIVFGLCLSVASTVVLLRALESRDQLRSVNGQIAVGWLVVEDLVMVLVLVLLPAIVGALHAQGSSPALELSEVVQALAITLGKIISFIGLMLIVGKRVLPKILWLIARTHSRELFTLSVVAVALGVAFGAAKLFDVSFALGAFIAGVVIRESEYSERAAKESSAFRDAFSVLFFVSVGMLFDPSVVWTEPLKVLGVVAIIMVGKTLAAVGLVLLFRYPLSTALTVGVSLAQIGEFSFILAGLGVSLNVLPAEGQSLVLAGAFVSIAANSFLFAAVAPVQRWMTSRSAVARQLEKPEDPLMVLPQNTDRALLDHQVVVVGHGRVGEPIARRLIAAGVPTVIVEQNRSRVEELRAQGIAAVSGDASTPEVLVQAHVTQAAVLVLTIPDPVQLRSIVDLALTLNPDIKVLSRVHSEEQASLHRSDLPGEVFIAELVLAQEMSERAIELMRRR